MTLRDWDDIYLLILVPPIEGILKRLRASLTDLDARLLQKLAELQQNKGLSSGVNVTT